LIGFSPSGGTLATCSLNPFRREPGAPIPIHLWDVGGPPFAAAKRIGEYRSERLNDLCWSWVDDPGRSWLFWECVAADDPEARLGELLPGVPTDAGDLDPTDDPTHLRVSPGGTYVALRSSDGAYVVRERATGRPRATTLPTKVSPVFGPGLDNFSSVDPADVPNRVTVRRWGLTVGSEVGRVAFDSPPHSRTRLTPDGRWAVVTQGGEQLGAPYSRLDLIDTQTGRRAVTDTGLHEWRLIAPAGRLVTVHHDARAGESRVLFWDVASGEVAAAVIPHPGSFAVLHVLAVAPDESVLALADHTPASMRSQNWPAPLRRAHRWVTAITGSDPGQVLLCSAATGHVLARLPADAGAANHLTNEGVVTFAPDGRRIAVLGAGGVVRVWDWPLRRPWAWILALAAAPPALLGFLARGWRRWRAWRTSPATVDAPAKDSAN
jgi:hypothetical protein